MKDTVKVFLESEVFFALCKSADTPVSLGCWLRFKYAEHAQLAGKSIEAKNYRSAEDFRVDYLITSFLSKWKGLRTGVDTEAEAYQRFKLAEDKCTVTNHRIRESRIAGSDPLTEAVIYTARRKIARLLGAFEWSKVLHGGWGPGATYDLKKSRAQLDRKMIETPFSVTPRCLPIFRKVLTDDLHWSAAVCGVDPRDIWGEFAFLPSVFEMVKGCRLTTVPKNAETDRTIAVEPRGNGFLQKGVGRYIRSRLRKVGIDLSNQGNNQEGARRALADGLATIDFKMASDTVAKELVFELLPVDWANALDDLRSPSFLLKDEWVRIEKFSSMGNGFTFELETLIFWALASALASDDQQQDVLVYGDDVIIPGTLAPAYLAVVTWCGFEVNTKKTHLDGCFHESCGVHFYNEVDVTPVYQKEVAEDVSSQIRCGNRLIRFALLHSDPSQGILHPLTKTAWLAVRRWLGITPYVIPLGYDGDDGLATPRAMFPKVPFCGNHGYRCTVLKQDTWISPSHEGALLALTLRKFAERDAEPERQPPNRNRLPVMTRWRSGRYFASVMLDFAREMRDSSRSILPGSLDDERADLRLVREKAYSAGWRNVIPRREFELTW